jgi:hypothetical protein
VAAEQHLPQPSATDSEPGADAALAARIRDMHRMLRTSGLPQDISMKLQHKLLKVCDAMKAPEADPARAEGRLDQLQTELQAELQREINRAAG